MRAGAAVALTFGLTACDDGGSTPSMEVVNGDPERGRELVRAYGCPACHQIPGIRARTGNLGPPLRGLAERGYLAGHVPNRPGNLVRWIMDPPSLEAATAMPNLGVTLADAHHIARYLYEIR